MAMTHEREAAPDSAPIRADSEIDIDSIDLGHSRSPWPYLAAGLLIGGAAVWAGGLYLGNTDAQELVNPETVELSTVSVTVATLSEEVEWTGTLGYGQAIEFRGSGGTVTSSAAVGSVLGRGDIVASIDAEKIPIWFGTTPLYRDLSEGDEGPDVKVLESNLVALGYDPEVTVTIDEVFTYNTFLMVERWQADVGNEITGLITTGSAAVVPGPVSVSAISGVGQSAGANVATLETRRVQTDLESPTAGVISNLAPIGSVAEPGAVLYTVGGLDVLAIDTSETASVEDDDVLHAAVAEGQIVESHWVNEGDWVPIGRPVMSASSSQLSVAVAISVSDETEFTEGQTVLVTLADESDVEGVVVEIGAVTQLTGDAAITILIDVIAAADVVLVEGPVTVTTVSSEIVDALVVPTRALVSLREGGYAVEVERNGSTQLVGIEIGSFDDGLVEITAGDLVEGESVVVPQ